MSAGELAAAFLVNAVAVAMLAPPSLRRVTGADSPAFPALLAWIGALAATASSAVAAVATGAVALVQMRGDLHRQLVGCLDVLLDAVWHGHYGAAVRITLMVAAGVLATACLWLASRLAMLLYRARARTSRHCRIVRLVGNRHPGLDGALLVDAPERAVYCVAGRHPAVVVTRGALDALDARQLTAVLAHERAHLAGHHHLLVAVTRAAAAVLPWPALFPLGARAVAHLVEVRADELAVRRTDRASLAAAMLALAGAGPLPGAALGASDVGLTQRVERLLGPPPATANAYLRVVAHSALVLAAGPVVAAVTMVGVPLLCRAVA